MNSLVVDDVNINVHDINHELTMNYLFNINDH